MKFFISILFFILSFSLNTHAQEESKNFEKEVKDYIEGKTDIKPKFLKTDNAIKDKKIQEMLDKADRLRNSNNNSLDTTDYLQKLKPRYLHTALSLATKKGQLFSSKILIYGGSNFFQYSTGDLYTCRIKFEKKKSFSEMVTIENTN